MRKGLLVAVLLAAALLAGCDGRLLLRMDIPIVIDPAPRYQGETWGYLSYEPYTEHIRLDSKPHRCGRYLPLTNATVSMVERYFHATADDQQVLGSLTLAPAAKPAAPASRKVE